MNILLVNTNKVALINDDDYSKISGFTWYLLHRGRKYHAVTYPEQGTTVYMHHLILPLTEDGKTVDHKDGNGLNNSQENLRYATKAQQMANRGHGSHFKGVFQQKSGKYFAQIRVERTSIYLGQFNSRENAAKAYNEAALKYFGEFAALNILEDK